MKLEAPFQRCKRLCIAIDQLTSAAQRVKGVTSGACTAADVHDALLVVLDTCTSSQQVHLQCSREAARESDELEQEVTRLIQIHRLSAAGALALLPHALACAQQFDGWSCPNPVTSILREALSQYIELHEPPQELPEKNLVLGCVLVLSRNVATVRCAAELFVQAANNASLLTALNIDGRHVLAALDASWIRHHVLVREPLSRCTFDALRSADYGGLFSSPLPSRLPQLLQGASGFPLIKFALLQETQVLAFCSWLANQLADPDEDEAVAVAIQLLKLVSTTVAGNCGDGAWCCLANSIRKEVCAQLATSSVLTKLLQLLHHRVNTDRVGTAAPSTFTWVPMPPSSRDEGVVRVRIAFGEDDVHLTALVPGADVLAPTLRSLCDVDLAATSPDSFVWVREATAMLNGGSEDERPQDLFARAQQAAQENAPVDETTRWDERSPQVTAVQVFTANGSQREIPVELATSLSHPCGMVLRSHFPAQASAHLVISIPQSFLPLLSGLVAVTLTRDASHTPRDDTVVLEDMLTSMRRQDQVNRLWAAVGTLLSSWGGDPPSPRLLTLVKDLLRVAEATMGTNDRGRLGANTPSTVGSLVPVLASLAGLPSLRQTAPGFAAHPTASALLSRTLIALAKWFRLHH